MMCRSQCMGYVKKELQCKNFWLRGAHRARFGLSQWPIPVGVYVAYRFVLAAYCTFWAFYYTDWQNRGITFNNTRFSVYAFLTVWTYIVLTVYLDLHFFVCLIYFFRRGGRCCSQPSTAGHRRMFPELETQPSLWGSQSGSYGSIPVMESPNTETAGDEDPDLTLPWYCIPVWLLYNVATVSALLVTIVFFIFLWPNISDGKPLDMENFQQHAANSIIIFVDSFMVAIPTRVLHLVHPLIYGLIYVLFSVLYWTGDHDRVMYPNILDWNQPGQTVVYIIVLALVGVPILHLFFFAIYKIKLHIYNRLFPATDS